MPDALLRSRGENKKLPHGGHSDGDDKHTHSWQLYQGAAQKKSFASRKMRAKVADSAKDPPCYIDKKKVSFSYKWIELYAQTKSWLILLQYDEYVSILDNDLLILCIHVFTLMTKSDSAICRWVQNSIPGTCLRIGRPGVVALPVAMLS